MPAGRVGWSLHKGANSRTAFEILCPRLSGGLWIFGGMGVLLPIWKCIVAVTAMFSSQLFFCFLLQSLPPFLFFSQSYYTGCLWWNASLRRKKQHQLWELQHIRLVLLWFYSKSVKFRPFEFLVACNNIVWMLWMETGGALNATKTVSIHCNHTKLLYVASKMVRDWQAILKNTCSYLIEDFLNKIHKLISLCFFSLRYWKACLPLLLYPSVCCRPFFLPRSVYSYIYIQSYCY